MVRAARKNYVIFFFVCVFVVKTNTGNDEEFFLRGNQKYAQKNYEDAFNAYEMVNKKGSAVLYNMGNCCFHKGDYAQALVYWQRAEIGATSQEYNRIARNKKYVAKLIGKENSIKMQQKIFTFLQDLLPYLSLFFLQFLFLLCWYLFVFLMGKKQIKLKKIIVSCIAVVLMSCGALLQVSYMQIGKEEGVVVKKDAQLLVGPDKGFQALCPLVYAHNVAVKEKREGWYKIQYADMIGWVEADIVQII
ncbi:MAG TPA: tetratricopeptide repeat protein [Candidatus Babeliales bacterium]|jgi:tetratricopeptide (TPR) repeat protein|nr:tetratricopeptide repeat protein [Candidatus Babeliales bacterium]